MLWIILTLLLGYLLYQKYLKPIMRFKKYGLKFRTPLPFFGDNIKLLIRRENPIDNIRNLYNAFPDERYIGTMQFSIPFIMLRDLEIIKQITVKDFDYFTDHRLLSSPDVEPLFSKNLFSLTGNEWREMRSTLSPAFTSSKMRGMFLFMDECAREVTQHFLDKDEDIVELELKSVFSKYTTDVIASTAFGLKCDSLKDENNEFYKMAIIISDPSTFRVIKFFIAFVFPSIVSKILNIKSTFFSKEVTEFFQRVITDTIEMREKQNLYRPDMLQLLMDAKKERLLQQQPLKVEDDYKNDTSNNKSEKYTIKELTDDDIMAQSMIFLLGGFESTSTTMCFMGHELAVNPDVQMKLIEEVDQVLENSDGKPTYEEVLKMKYLDQVISETLRKWTPGFQSDRRCTRDYTIEPKNPNEKQIQIKKDDLLLLPVVGIHYDPKYFPDPECFDPDRFSEENKKNLVPGSYMPFGLGPRNCIGFRFALLETKILFVRLLSKFEFVVTEKTQVPIKVSFRGINIYPVGGFPVGLKQRKLANI